MPQSPAVQSWKGIIVLGEVSGRKRVKSGICDHGPRWCLQIGVIGLGQMGSRMAANLLTNAGQALVVCDERAEAMHNAAQLGAETASTPAAVASTEGTHPNASISIGFCGTTCRLPAAFRRLTLPVSLEQQYYVSIINQACRLQEAMMCMTSTCRRARYTLDAAFLQERAGGLPGPSRGRCCRGRHPGLPADRLLHHQPRLQPADCAGDAGCPPAQQRPAIPGLRRGSSCHDRCSRFWRRHGRERGDPDLHGGLRLSVCLYQRKTAANSVCSNQSSVCLCATATALGMRNKKRTATQLHTCTITCMSKARYCSCAQEV